MSLKNSRKGIEGMPLVLAISILVLAIALGASFGFLTNFLSSTTASNFHEDVLDLWQTMNTLVSTGDRGSFHTSYMTIPDCCSLNVSIDENKLVGIINNETFSLQAPGDITQVVTTSVNANGTISFDPGRYELRLYYGTPDNFTSWMIVFV